MANLRCPKCGDLLYLERTVTMSGVMEIDMGPVTNEPVDAYLLTGEADIQPIKGELDMIQCPECFWSVTVATDIVAAVNGAIALGAVLD